ncbi:lysosomal alpha-mannosidase-like [Trichoplusia ni]|uniref:Alpha-mannosidase n=1 Tax=Trichoplusia ni TaxID=7111 RepID=A0A7E5X4Y4_TRINI|nr:lysosomal alpha-mannosidase-like [Trichoplusia ni]
MSMDAIAKDLLTPMTEGTRHDRVTHTRTTSHEFNFLVFCLFQSCPRLNEGALNVHIVPATHGELGYTRTFYQHYTGYDDFYDHSKVNMKNILDAVITALWTHDNRKFTLSDLPYLFHWWKNRDGTVRRMVYQLLRQGRLFIAGGGWSMSDEATTSYHAIIDHFTYSLRKLNATFLSCSRPLVTWQADVYGHSREFASLMAQMGFDGHFINPISYEDELVRMKTKTLEFVWRGSDDLGADSDIYTHKLFDGYWTPPGFCFGGFCNDPLIITSDSTFNNVEERINLFIKHMNQRQAPYYTTRNVMVIMGQRLGYHDAPVWFANVDKLISLVNAKQTAIKNRVFLFYSTPACYLKAVQEAAPKLSTKQDDFLPYTYDKDTHTSGMFTSRPVIKYLAREIHHFLQMAKQLQIFAKLGNNDRRFEDIMWIAGVMQDHTIITGAMRPYVSDYYARKVYLAKELCIQMYRPAFNILRKSPKSMQYYACQFNISSCWTMSEDRFFIVIYNPLAWPVTRPIRLPVARGVYHVYDPKGAKQNHSIITIHDLIASLPDRGEILTEDELVFIAEKIPPMGFRSYYIQQLHARTRQKRSIIKKLNKNKKKKYLTRQTNNLKIDDKSLLDDIQDYEDFEENTERPRIQFGNISLSNETDFYPDYVVTPPTRINRTTTEVPPSRTTSNPTTTTTISSSSSTTTASSSPPTSSLPLYPEYEYVEVTDKPEATTEYIDYDKYYRRMEQAGYHSFETTRNYINNEYILITFDNKYRLTEIQLLNGVNISFHIEMCYYISDDPVKLGLDKKKPGAYVFRPMDPQPILISDYFEAKALKTDIVQELHLKFSTYAGVALRLYTGLPTIEVDWIVGPIPMDDGYGKDVFIRYASNIVNKGAFYTDSNGRQTIKRMRDMRATYKQTNVDNIPGNFYPVTSKIYIEDLERNVRMSVFTDRAQGGTSLIDGNIDLMLHRRIFTDDSGIQTFLNETEFGRGLIVTGKHYLYLSKADHRANKVFEKKFAKELELQPKVFSSIHPSYVNISYDLWNANKNEYSALRMKVPIGVHILTIEKLGDKLLLRLENYLEKADVVRNGVKVVFIKELFMDFVIVDVKETTLAGNIYLEDYTPMQWQKDRFVKNFNEFYGNSSGPEFTNPDSEFIRSFERVNLDTGIELQPQQIRTFVVTYVLV